MAILFVGQLIARKGVEDLVAAHELLVRRGKGEQLVLVGYGQLEAALRARLSRAGTPGAHFSGHVPLSELPGYYVTADVLVLPSHEEVWGLVLNEAAASGLPLVTTEPVGAAPNIVIEGKTASRSRLASPRPWRTRYNAQRKQGKSWARNRGRPSPA